MTVNLPRVGETFLDRYELVRIVGHGGYGRIYEATQLDIGRRVALKIIAPPDEEDPRFSSETFAERFEREARAISQLKDPHTVTMYDHGEHDGLLYMVLEFIDGVTLSQAIEDDGPLPSERVDHILRQILVSLMEAHAKGLVHRDIKPSNIMLHEHMGKSDQVKLLDFGLVKSITGEQLVDAENLTRADVLVGTPRYMSPEQVQQHPIAPATDVYSLGLVAYEMLVGQPLLTESQAMAIIARHINKAEFDLSDMPGTPVLQAAIAKMLRKDPSSRFGTAAEALEALDEPVVPPPPQRNNKLPLILVLIPLLIGAAAVLWPSPEPAASQTQHAAAVETDPTPSKPVQAATVAISEPAAPSLVAPTVDPNVQGLMSAIGWSTARVGIALESAEESAQEAADDTQRRRQRLRRNRRKKDDDGDGERNLRIFEP